MSPTPSMMNPEKVSRDVWKLEKTDKKLGKAIASWVAAACWMTEVTRGNLMSIGSSNWDAPCATVNITFLGKMRGEINTQKMS